MKNEVIDPRLLAAKIGEESFIASAFSNFPNELSQLRELLWFLQWHSMKPGGLKKLTAGIVADLMPAYEKAAAPWYIKDSPEKIPGKLAELCIDPKETFETLDLLRTWPALFKSLFDLMEQHAADTLKTIAQTEVTKTIFRELEFSIRKGVPVPIIGESRIGKTKPASVWCDARPGRARLVDVPESNRDRDFVTAHADAFGIEYTNRTSTQVLRADVQYVNQRSGLFLVYDESQFLVPVNYSKTTAPHRLNWVRRQVVDRDRGCGLIATPQSYRQTLDHYVKTTGYRIEQWLGRLAPAVILPADLGTADLLAVAKLHFPEMPVPFLKLIAARAMRSEGYLKNLEITAKRASFLAEEQGRAHVTIEDVKQAIAQMMPETVAPAAPRPRAVSTPLNDRLKGDLGHDLAAENAPDANRIGKVLAAA
jgi:hypothetical protein